MKNKLLPSTLIFLLLLSAFLYIQIPFANATTTGIMGITATGTATGNYDVHSSRVRGSNVTCTDTGTLTVTSITAYLKASGSATINGKAAIYTVSNNTLVGATDELSISATTSWNWFTFTFSTQPTITNTNYYLLVWLNNTSAQTFSMGNTSNATERGYYHDGYTYGSAGNFPATVSLTKYEDNGYALYATYNIGDTTPPTFGTITTNSTLVNQPATLSCTVSDNTAVSFTGIATNNTGIWVNQTATTTNPISYTLTWNATVGNIIGVQCWANDTSNNAAYSTITYFTLTSTSWSGIYLGVASAQISTINGVAIGTISKVNGSPP